MTGGWGVYLHDDDVNGYPVVGFVLNRVCGLPREHGLGVADQMSRHGRAPVLTQVSREEAERVTAEIVLLGLRASLEPMPAAEPGSGHAAPAKR